MSPAHRGTVSKLGIFLDPIADKIMIAAVILLLVFTRDVDGWHVIAALIILLRGNYRFRPS